MTQRTLVVIPAYNEEATIERVVKLSKPYADVCVVDDASYDRTPEILARIEGVHVIRHRQNTHIARALLDGMRFADEAGYDFCITMDCGLSHDPLELPLFTRVKDAELVIGRRKERLRVPVYRKLLSWSGRVTFNLALNSTFLPWKGARLKDVTSGYRMYSRRAFELLLLNPLQSRSFDFHLEALAIIYRAGMRIVEIPITYVFSNSSLRWNIVQEATKTCMRIWANPSAGRPASKPTPGRFTRSTPE